MKYLIYLCAAVSLVVLVSDARAQGRDDRDRRVIVRDGSSEAEIERDDEETGVERRDGEGSRRARRRGVRRERDADRREDASDPRNREVRRRTGGVYDRDDDVRRRRGEVSNRDNRRDSRRLPDILRDRDYDPYEDDREYGRRRGPSKIPPGHLPPPGECRVWYDDRPPGHQPPPRPCRSIRDWHHPNAVVIDSDGRAYRRYDRYPDRRDRNPDERDRYPDRRDRDRDGRDRYPDRRDRGWEDIIWPLLRGE